MKRNIWYFCPLTKEQASGTMLKVAARGDQKIDIVWEDLSMFQVIKRDGQIAEFDLTKISGAVAKAFEATQKQYNKDMIDLLSLRVTSDFQDKIKNNQIDVESIQDSVENTLVQAGYGDVAKAYILYRKQREKIRNMKSTILDYKEIVDSYVKVEDWRVKENSTVTYSVGGRHVKTFKSKYDKDTGELISKETVALSSYLEDIYK